VGGGWREARHHNHAASKATATESTCNASRMSHPLYDKDNRARGGWRSTGLAY